MELWDVSEANFGICIHEDTLSSIVSNEIKRESTKYSYQKQLQTVSLIELLSIIVNFSSTTIEFHVALSYPFHTYSSSLIFDFSNAKTKGTTSLANAR